MPEVVRSSSESRQSSKVVSSAGRVRPRHLRTRLPMTRPSLPIIGFLAIAFSAGSPGRCSAQEVIHLAGQPISFTPEFDAENRPVAFGEEQPAAMLLAPGG